jgi:hypothetical protein
MTSDEKRLLQTIVLTLADPKGNWRFAWDSLCKMAEIETDRYQAPFKTHPLDIPGGGRDPGGTLP